MRLPRIILLIVACISLLHISAQEYIVDPVGQFGDEIITIANGEAPSKYLKDTLKAGDVITVIGESNNSRIFLYQTENGTYGIDAGLLKFSDENPEGTVDVTERFNIVKGRFFDFNRHSWFGKLMFGFTFPIIIFILIGISAAICYKLRADSRINRNSIFRKIMIWSIILLSVIEVFYIGTVGMDGFWWADTSYSDKISKIIISTIFSLLVSAFALAQVYIGKNFVRIYQCDDNAEHRFTLKPLFISIGIIVVSTLLSAIFLNDTLTAIVMIATFVAGITWFVKANTKAMGYKEAVKFCVIAFIYSLGMIFYGTVALVSLISAIVTILIICAMVFFILFVFTSKRKDGTNPFFENSKEDQERERKLREWQRRNQ